LREYWERPDVKRKLRNARREMGKKGPKKKKKKKKKRISRAERSEIFFNSDEWLAVRYIILKKYGRKCMLCKTTNGVMHVDHIKPRSKYPKLALDEDNLQVLCKACNFGKSNVHEDDWRDLRTRVVIR